jgi:hypothetical protein
MGTTHRLACVALALALALALMVCPDSTSAEDADASARDLLKLVDASKNGARMVPPNSVGDRRTAADDVVIDGKIQTGQDASPPGKWAVKWFACCRSSVEGRRGISDLEFEIWI